jgi:hypothetical protein
VVFGVLQQRPASVFEALGSGRLIAVAQRVPVAAADLVERAVGERDDVIGVDADDRLRRVLSRAACVAGSHVQRDRLKLGGARPDVRLIVVGLGDVGERYRGLAARGRIEVGEERVGDRGAATLGAPHDLATAVVGDQRQVAMAAAPRDLVDADVKEIIQAPLVKLLVADTRDDAPHGLPVHAHQPADRRLVGLGGKPRHQIVEIARQAGAVTRERHCLDTDAVLRTAQLAQPRADFQAPHTEIEMPPDRVVRLHALARGRAEGAQRADQPTATQRDTHDDTVLVEGHGAYPYPLEAQQTPECLGDAHGNDLRLAGPRQPGSLRRNRARPLNPAQTRKLLH